MTGKNTLKRNLKLLGAAALLLLVLSPLYINAHRPSFVCFSCHEMRGPWQAWRTSTHRGVNCTNCHNAPNGFRMLLSHIIGPSTSWAEKNKASFKTCVKCHARVTGVVYFHSIKFPHEAHQKHLRDCRVCHENVVHGSRIEYRNSPKKKTCFTCHDNRKASRKCSLCHLSFTKKLPQQMDPKWIASHKSDVARFKTQCVRCHKKQFCKDCHLKVNPHPATWLKAHPVKARRTTRKCQTCHNAAYCSRCHGILQQHGADWYDGHRRMARDSVALCRRCHNEAYCDSCHKGFKLHAPGWLQRHRADPRAKTEAGCAACHTKKYCGNCHGGKPTLHHKGNWLSRHGAAIAAHTGEARDIDTCITCHSPGFCLACHRGLNKNVHSRNYLSMHRNVTPQSMPQCKMCHTIESCNQCHKSKLPADHRAADWKNTHGIRAIRNMDSCTLCHEKAFCEACHNRRVPASHEPKEIWARQHGHGSQTPGSQCSLCHEDRFCNTCHRRNKPPDHYSDDWPQTHGRTAIGDMSNCSVCHDKKDCKRCHAEKRVHQAAGWMKDHDVSKSNQPFSQCAQCHWLGTCTDCHHRYGVKGHADCTACHASMSDRTKLKPDPCAKCHQQLALKEVHKKHEALDCPTCHKPHNMKPASTTCVSCHKKVEDHTMGGQCLDCHSFK